MSKMQRFVRALMNNGIKNYMDYTLLRADEEGYLFIQENKTKREFRLNVEGVEPIAELNYVPLGNSPRKPEKQEILSKVENTVPLIEEEDELEEDLMKNQVSEKERLAQEVEQVRKAQEEELRKLIEKPSSETENKDKKENQTKHPRGWHFRKEYIDEDGNVYHFGKLQSTKK
jgi:hypothetical protein